MREGWSRAMHSESSLVLCPMNSLASIKVCLNLGMAYLVENSSAIECMYSYFVAIVEFFITVSGNEMSRVLNRMREIPVVM